MSNIDLHIHTLNSDGEYNINQIIQMLIREQIEYFSITDHDNVDSCFEIEKIILPLDIKHIPGVEFSSILNKIKCHILGYNIDYRNCNIIIECNNIKKRRIERLLKIIDYLKETYGIELNQEEINTIFKKNGTIGRTDLYLILLNRGYGTKKEIYEKYLNIHPNLPYRSNAEDIIKIIKLAGGKSILAHPKEIEEEYQICIEEIIEQFIEIGLDGIEVFNNIHTLKDVKRYLALAQKYGLLTTGGSDYHGESVKPNVNLGGTTTEKRKIQKKQINFL